MDHNFLYRDFGIRILIRGGDLSPIKYPGVLIYLVIGFPIYFNFEFQIEKFVYTRYGIFKIFTKYGLVKEALGKLEDLTRL